MGAYKIDKICNDFDTVMKGLDVGIVDQMKIIAVEILETLPDNKGRDLAISNLLYTAEFVKSSLVLEAAKQKKKDSKPLHSGKKHNELCNQLNTQQGVAADADCGLCKQYRLEEAIYCPHCLKKFNRTA